MNPERVQLDAMAATPQSGWEDPFRPCCLSVDLEVGKKNGRIHSIGAVRPDTGGHLTFSRGTLSLALERLDALADGAAFILGHNLVAFDLPHLRAARPDLRLLQLPAVDTLRLSPLAFPRNPYHRLVKHYQDGRLVRWQVNDPELDSRLAVRVFEEQVAALGRASLDILAAWHWLTTPDADGADRAMNDLFYAIRRSRRPSRTEACAAISRQLDGAACPGSVRAALDAAERLGWELAYVLAWISVSDGNSVMPPWVRHQFPGASRLVRRLRDTPCGDPACPWCGTRHDARTRLRQWFGFADFRPEPTDDEGRPMQKTIVEAAMVDKHVLGILPTGAGKSVCYQVPALSRYENTGAITVVISPLVALMADQVSGMEARGIGCCVSVNGLLSMPERADALDRVRLGDAGILLTSPEQLRSRSLVRALSQREIGGWVIDEAHCLSQWGHDFRPDYRYVGRFIRKMAGDGSVPPMLCLTATARPDVIEDVVRHFHDLLGIELNVFNGGADRPNLEFEVMPTTQAEKFSSIHRVFSDCLPSGASGGAIVYCATRRQTEEVAEYLQAKRVAADYYHAGLPPESKKEVQHRFINGELRAIAATNAFGMGIDKPDVRLVIHADIPGSLESYFQEAGRAGRDRAFARCVLLYAPDDVERQFAMSAYARLSRREINGILRALRNLDRKKRFRGEVLATAGEILVEDDDGAFERDSATDDTRVRTSIAWLEESQLLTREENLVSIFPSSLRVNSLQQAEKRLRKVPILQDRRRQLLSIIRAIIEAGADEGVTTDELMAVSGLDPQGVRTALHDLEQFGISSNDTALTAFVHVGVKRHSRKRLQESDELESSLIEHMRESAPDAGKEDTSYLQLRVAAQVLRDEGLPDPLPERLWRLVRGIAADGRGEGGKGGSLSVRKRDAETVRVTLLREWDALERTSQLRRQAAGTLLEHLIACLPPGSRGTDLLAKTTLGKLLQAIEADLNLNGRVRHPTKLLDRALLWLHEQEVIRLNRGLAVFRPAMTIRLEQRDRRGFATADFQPLAIHYNGRVLQIHVMAEYAERGLTAMTDAIRLAMDYFSLGEEEFLERWLRNRGAETKRQTTPKSWWAIVGSLKNPIQQRIVADDRKRTNTLVLAGPGSGKTRVLVHRIAYLIRVRRERPRGILALAYNRHAAVDIRRRLRDLVGDDARGVTVLTCHALAMRLAGFSFSSRAERPDDGKFSKIMTRAVELLRGEGLPPEEADERRARLLAGFRWILVDEYQDIGPEQYALISALAGRTLDHESGKLTLFAVGDDDQNIYAFNGASVEFIRRFETDYSAKTAWLTDNYRSTRHILTAPEAVIARARERMKAGHPIRINRIREADPPGGEWERQDSVSRGRVQILAVRHDPVAQAQAVMAELQRLASSAPDWDWSRCAVIAREWKYLIPVRAYCATYGIPVQMADEKIPRFWSLRETRLFTGWLRDQEPGVVTAKALRDKSNRYPPGPWYDLLRQAVKEHALEAGSAETPVRELIEWLSEWGWDIRRRQRGLLLSTAHRAKGLEFDHVAVLDGGWGRIGPSEDADAPRRLYYVAMTRARKTLMLARRAGPHDFLDAIADHRSVIFRSAADLPPGPPALRYSYVRPALQDVDLGYAGRFVAGHPLHGAIARLSAGDSLEACVNGRGRWELLDQAGIVVGRLATSFEPPRGTRCRSAEVAAVVGWSREASRQEFHDSIRCDEWEVIVPELTFEPARAPAS